jgi:hypothetical protein
MTIDGVNISAFGMKVLNLDDYYSLPARKKILAEPGTEAKDIVFQPQTATIKLLGRVADTTDLLTKLEAFETLIKSSLKHDVVLMARGESFVGVFDRGYELQMPFINGKIITVNLPVTICLP